MHFIWHVLFIKLEICCIFSVETSRHNKVLSLIACIHTKYCKFRNALEGALIFEVSRNGEITKFRNALEGFIFEVSRNGEITKFRNALEGFIFEVSRNGEITKFRKALEVFIFEVSRNGEITRSSFTGNGEITRSSFTGNGEITRLSFTDQIMLPSHFFYFANMSFNVIRENEILAIFIIIKTYKPSVLLWDIGKQWKTRSDAAKRGV